MKHEYMKRILILTLLVLSSAASAFAQSVKVSGTVKDSEGNPLPGVYVIDKQAAAKGTATDVDGKYELNVVSEGFIEFSCLGFESLLEPVNGRTKIDVVLKSEAAKLDDVVVIAYGTSKKSDLTGAVSVVDMKSLADVPASSVSSALQGRIAGMDMMSSTGEPGAEASIQIRGARSISAGNAPLIVVDGVIDAVSDLNEINPSDIKSISVLKDVSSTSLYGSRGANGVILITTERETSRNFTASLKAAAGVSRIMGSLDLMDASEFAKYCNMTHYISDYMNGTENPSRNFYFSDEEIAAKGKGTDWIDALSQTGVYQDYTFSAQGGTNITRASASFGYHNERGVVIGSGFSRISGRVSVETQPLKWLRAGVRLYYADRSTDKSSASITGTNSTAAIYLSPLLGINDTWNTFGSEYASGGSPFNNPYICAKQISNDVRQTNLNLLPWVRLIFNRYASFVSKFSFTTDGYKSLRYAPSTLPVAQRNLTGGTATAIWQDRQIFLSENTFTYDRTFSRRHTLNLLAGFTAERTNIDYRYFYGEGYMDDNVTYKNLGGLLDDRNTTNRSYENIKTSMSVLARVNYDYLKKYYVTLTMRADGASNFADNRKWGIFPAAALRWNISREDFLAGASWLDDLSLRASVGRSGNDAIGSYMSKSTLTSDKGVWMLGDYRPLAYYDTRLSNGNLTWETTDSYNIGLNFSAFGERVNLEVDAYESRTSDLLLAMKTNQSTGYDTYFTNMGNTRNRGIEVALTTRNIVTRKFSWSTMFTISHNDQLVIDAGEDRLVPTYSNFRNLTQPLYGYRAGYPVNSLWGYQYAGVWHSQDEIDRNKISKTYVSSGTEQLGICRYVDQNNDGLLDQNDLVYQGNADPVVYGGLQNTFTLGNLSLKVYATYSFGGKIYNISEILAGSGSRAYNKYRYMLDAWDPELNPDSNIPRAGKEDYNASDRMIYDASYIRLKEVSLSYRFNVAKKWCKSIVVGASGENLLLWKRYNGFDPDVSTSATTRRIDNGAFPRPRTFVINLQMNF